MSTKFTVGLGDEVTGPADRIAKGLKRLYGAATKLEEQAGAAAEAATKVATEAAKAAERASSSKAGASERAAEREIAAAKKVESAQAAALAKQEARANAVSAKLQAQAEKDASRSAAREAAKVAKEEARALNASSRMAARKIADEERTAKRAAAAVAREERKANQNREREAKRAAAKAEREAVKTAAKGSFVGNLAADAAQEILALGRNALFATKNFVALGQSQKFMFDATSGGRSPVGDLLEHSDALAMRFGLDLDDTRQRYRDLMDLELDTGSIDTFVRLGASMKATGEEASSVNALMTALAKIKVKGVLDQRGLMALGQAGVQRTHLLDALAKELGAASADEADLATALGKKGLSAEKAIGIVQNAIMAGVDETSPGERAAKFADSTIGGIEGKVRARATSIAHGVAEGLEKPLGEIAQKLNAKLAEVDIDQVTADIKSMSESLSTLASAVGAVGKAGAWLFGGVTEMGGDLAFRMSDRAANFAAKGKAEGNGMTPVTSGQLGELGGGIVDVVQWALGFRSDGASAGARTGEGLAQGITDSTPMAVAAATGMAAATAAALSGELEIHSPSRLTRRMGRFTGKGLSLGIRDSEGETVGAATAVAKATAAAMTLPSLDALTIGEVASPTAAAPAVGNAAAAGTGRGWAPITVGPFIVEGGASPEETAQLTMTMVRREIESVFEELAEQVA